MQMTPSTIKLDIVDLNKLITGMGLLWTLFLHTFEMKSYTVFHRYSDIEYCMEHFTTQTQRQQWYKEFNTGCSLMVTN